MKNKGCKNFYGADCGGRSHIRHSGNSKFFKKTVGSRLLKKPKSRKPKKAASVAAVSDETVTAEKKEPVKISMLSVGDNLIHDGIYEQAKKAF